MTLIEAVTAAVALYPTPAVRAQVVTSLILGTSDLCDACGFIKIKGTVCEVCENAWADEQAAIEEEKSFWLAEAGAFRF